MIPIGTDRLRAALQWLRIDADGDQKAGDVAVFSNEAGEPIKIFKESWVVAVCEQLPALCSACRLALSEVRLV